LLLQAASIMMPEHGAMRTCLLATGDASQH
jgi:hypothetical protein